MKLTSCMHGPSLPPVKKTAHAAEIVDGCDAQECDRQRQRPWAVSELMQVAPKPLNLLMMLIGLAENLAFSKRSTILIRSS